MSTKKAKKPFIYGGLQLSNTISCILSLSSKQRLSPTFVEPYVFFHCIYLSKKTTSTAATISNTILIIKPILSLHICSFSLNSSFLSCFLTLFLISFHLTFTIATSPVYNAPRFSAVDASTQNVNIDANAVLSLLSITDAIES